MLRYDMEHKLCRVEMRTEDLREIEYKGIAVVSEIGEIEKQRDKRYIMWFFLKVNKKHLREKRGEYTRFMVSMIDITDIEHPIFMGQVLTADRNSSLTYMYRVIMAIDDGGEYENAFQGRDISAQLYLRPDKIYMKLSDYEKREEDEGFKKFLKEGMPEGNKPYFRVVEKRKEYVQVELKVPHIIQYGRLDCEAELYALLLSYLRGKEVIADKDNRNQSRGISVRNAQIGQAIKDRIIRMWGLKKHPWAKEVEYFKVEEKVQGKKAVLERGDIYRLLKSFLGDDEGYTYSFKEDRYIFKDRDRISYNYIQLHPEKDVQKIQKGTLTLRRLSGKDHLGEAILEEHGNSKGHHTRYEGIVIITNTHEPTVATAWVFLILKKTIVNGIEIEKGSSDITAISFNVSPNTGGSEVVIRLAQALTVSSASGSPTMIRAILSQENIREDELSRFFIPFIRIVDKGIYIEKRYYDDLLVWLKCKLVKKKLDYSNPNSYDVYRGIEQHFKGIDEEGLSVLHEMLHPKEYTMLGIRTISGEDGNKSDTYVELDYFIGDSRVVGEKKRKEIEEPLEYEEYVGVFNEILGVDENKKLRSIAVDHSQMYVHSNIDIENLYRYVIRLRGEDE